MANVNSRKLRAQRQVSIIKLVDPPSEDEDDKAETFQAQPNTELPKNRLIEKLCNGLTLFVQRMQKRESFYVTIKKIRSHKWAPAPRECASLTFVNYSAFLLGGLNFDVSKEVAQLSLTNLETDDLDQVKQEWINVSYESNDKHLGRCRHTSVTFDD